MLRAIFRTHSFNHGVIAKYAGTTDQVVGAAIGRMVRKGYVRFVNGRVAPIRTVLGLLLKQPSDAQRQALVEAAVKRGKVTKCEEAHASGITTFLPFGGRWFS